MRSLRLLQSNKRDALRVRGNTCGSARIRPPGVQLMLKPAGEHAYDDAIKAIIATEPGWRLINNGINLDKGDSSQSAAVVASELPVFNADASSSSSGVADRFGPP